ncbi:branched-chain amino acid transport system II carrier protein [Clostridium minihomine]|uniref:branched-chain amino acid transport system II carrier protein n=1 Tax=Clostridium minihomine TaxID=2045012 RepID=UPI000C77DF3A|nr:branched-chain amino acid transport system II carrier protein [Clostridium minihomine]
MDKKLSFSSYLLVGSMLFGLFFGAGNLIFPVHMGQEAGANTWLATAGFLTTAIGLPFLGVIAIGVSGSNGLFDLASRVHPIYGYVMTILLYLTIGPFFALPRTATVSYEIGLVPFLPESFRTTGLAIFTLIFFAVALAFSLKPNQLLVWVGKVLNPLFLAVLAVLIVLSLVLPMGTVSSIPVMESYESAPFFKGFLEGYNTMDALASLAFGIIVVNSLKDLGVKSPKGIALDTVRSGAVSILLMGLIYGFLAYMGASSAGQFAVSQNGGIALAQIANYYLGAWGSVLLAVIVTIACLKTAIGLITACSQTFCELFPNKLNYKTYTVIFTVISLLVANVGLTQIISLSIPVLMFLYPLAICLILLGILSPLFHNRRCVYLIPTLFTLFASVGDLLAALPAQTVAHPFFAAILAFYRQYLPFFSLGMGWVVPLVAGMLMGFLVFLITKKKNPSRAA